MEHKKMKEITAEEYDNMITERISHYWQDPYDFAQGEEAILKAIREAEEIFRKLVN
jgi:hypothetical protein